MKQITIYQAIGLKLLTIFTLLVFFSNCSKDCVEHTYNLNVDENYLPDIIPYSDTSSRLFLKNGVDTLLFKSQGLKKEIVKDYSDDGSCDIFNLQNISLKMSASDSNFFNIAYYTIKNGIPRVKIEIDQTSETNEYGYYDFKDYNPPILSYNVLNVKYDTIKVLYMTDNLGAIYLKPKFGVIKIQIQSNIYELIK